jgi:potassium-transporting ATPase KdpC subunit
MFTTIKSALVMLTIMTLLTGVIYPLLATGLAQLIFRNQANGSLITDKQGQQPIGSALIGQSFSDPKYFWGRPSATSPYPYNAAASSGSNLGPTNSVLKESVAARIEALKAIDPENIAPIPVDLVTTSASGLDPHISPAAAEYQVLRVAKQRHLDINAVRQFVKQNTKARQWGVFGEARVNVLLLNRALDGVTYE